METKNSVESDRTGHTRLLHWLGAVGGMLCGIAALWLLGSGTASAESGHDTAAPRAPKSAEVLDLSKTLEPITKTVTAPVHAVAKAVAPVVQRTTKTLEPVTAPLKPLVEPVLRSVEPVTRSLAPVLDRTGLAPVVHDVVGSVAPVLTPVTDTVGATPVLDAVVPDTHAASKPAKHVTKPVAKQVKVHVPAAGHHRYTPVVRSDTTNHRSLPATGAASAPGARANGSLPSGPYSPTTPTDTANAAMSTSTAGQTMPVGVVEGTNAPVQQQHQWRGPPRYWLGPVWCDYYGHKHPS